MIKDRCPICFVVIDSFFNCGCQRTKPDEKYKRPYYVNGIIQIYDDDTEEEKNEKMKTGDYEQADKK